jgi:tryptophan synthase beta subunit
MKSKPDDHGKYGIFGGKFAPEVLMTALEELESAFNRYNSDKSFRAELNGLLSTYAGRPTPLYLAKNLSEMCDAKIYLKREDLVQETNNCGDGCRSARCSNGNGGCGFRHGLRGIYGH